MAVLTVERVERPPSLFGPAEAAIVATPVKDPARERGGELDGGLTLDDEIVGAWEGLAAQLVVACPLCGGALRPHPAPDAVGGRCGDCGTTLD